MYNMQYVRINQGHDNMEFIINRFVQTDSVPLIIVEVGHSLPPNGKSIDLVSTCYQLHYVIHGKGTFRKQEICEGNGFLVLPGESYEMSVNSDNFEQYWINFCGSDAKNLLYSCGLSASPRVFDFGIRQSTKNLVDSLLKSIFSVSQDNSCPPIQHSHTFLVGLLYQLLCVNEVSKAPAIAPSEQYTSAICSYIRVHYPEKLTVDWLAAVVGLSPKYLIRIFKNAMGCTLIQYITKVRLDAACNLLENTGKSIREVAEAVGCADALYFSKVFRSAYGISPSRFRNNKT